MFESPSYLSPDFAQGALGYLGVPARRLADFARRLPLPRTLRERAISAAIEWGVANPDAWDEAIRPLRFTKRATFAVRDF